MRQIGLFWFDVEEHEHELLGGVGDHGGHPGCEGGQKHQPKTWEL